MRTRGLALLRERVEESPTRHLAWLPIQRAFLADLSRRKLIRTGNQFFGKSTALCEEAARLAEGRHPDPHMRDRPLRILVISINAPQSVQLQVKMHKHFDKSALSSTTDCDPVLGFRGRYPAARFKNGSIILFKSGDAGPRAFAGETCDAVIIDEPTTEAIYREADRRVTMRGGYVIMGMTPINLPGPIDWLRELVAVGVVSEHWTPLTADAVIPVGHDEPRHTEDGEPIDAEFIARQRAAMRSIDAPIVLDGEWDIPPTGQVFPAYDPREHGAHITRSDPAGDGWRYVVGIDHGERDHKQCAVLVAVRDAGVHPEVHILDEFLGEGLTTPEQDAAGIMAMLSRWSLSWADLHHVRGDKPHDVYRVVGSVARKSNADLTVALARMLNIHPGNLRPPIRQAKKGAGARASVDRGCRWLHTIMLREGTFHVDHRCTQVRASLQNWTGKDDEFKDIIDAVRYATWDEAMRTQRITGTAGPLRLR